MDLNNFKVANMYSSPITEPVPSAKWVKSARAAEAQTTITSANPKQKNCSVPHLLQCFHCDITPISH